MQRINDRATNQGLQARTGGQNLSGYRQDCAATLPPGQVQPKSIIIPFFPFTARIPQSAAIKIARSEYDSVMGSHQWDLAGDPSQV